MIGTIFGLLIPLMGTVLGSAFVFFMRNEMPARLQKALLGFASGIMVAASIWSLIIPSMDMWADQGRLRIITPLVCFVIGISLLLVFDYIKQHRNIWSDRTEGPHTKLSRTAMLTFAVTIHNLPEGMAVGVVLAGALQIGSAISTAAAMTMAIGIAIQNIPEGAIISMPMREAGNSRLKSFIIGSLSGIVEPIGGILVILLASTITPALPYLLSFAAGAMFYVVVEELIPEASEGEHSNLSTIGFAIGFALMMTLDVVLG